MKNIINGIGIILGFLYILSIISFFTNAWGAIGFFGSIITLPISVVIGTIAYLLGGIGSAIVTILWLVIIYALTTYGE